MISKLNFLWIVLALSGNLYADDIDVKRSSPPKASQSEAEAGTDNSKMMTPLRTQQAVTILGGNVTGQASSIDNEISLFSGTTGKVIKRATTTGIVKAASGVISAVTTSLGLSGEISDETGSGALVFGTSPAFTTQITTPSIVSVGALGITPASGSNVNITLATTGDLAVNTNQLYVDTSSGNVGVGTSTPNYNLVVNDSNGSGLGILNTGTGDTLYQQQTNTATLRNACSIKANGYDAVYMNTQNSYPLILGVSTATTSGTAVANMTILSSGYVGIGISPTAQLHTTGTVRMQNFGAGTATFDANGNISSVSDERLKNILGNFQSGLSEVLQIKPIVYKWNEKSGLDITNNYVGFSAQNLSKYIPEAVSINSEGYLSVSDRAVIAALVNAVKTLSDEVDSLKLKLSLPLTSHTVIANTDITKLGKTNYAKILRTPVLQGEETWGYIEEGTESKAQAVSAVDAFTLVPEYTQKYLREEVKTEFILEGEDVKQVTKIVPVYEQVFVKLQKKLKENVSLNSETGTFYKNVKVPKLVYRMKKGVSFDEVTKVYMRDETSAEALARVGKEIVSIIPKL